MASVERQPTQEMTMNRTLGTKLVAIALFSAFGATAGTQAFASSGGFMTEEQNRYFEALDTRTTPEQESLHKWYEALRDRDSNSISD